MIWRFLSFHLFQILAEEHFQFIKWYIVTLATIVEIAMRGSGDDEQLLVLWVWVGGANELIALSTALHHILIGSLAKITRVGFLTMHHEDGRTNLIDVVEEAGVGVGLSADDAPTVVRVARAGMIAARGLVIVVVVLHELGCIIG